MARSLSALASQADFRRLRAIALAFMALAAMALPAHYALSMDGAFAMVRDRIDDTNYAYPARPIAIAPVRGGIALLVEAGPQDCHFCQGELSVFYLRPDQDGWRVAGAWPRLGGAGYSGGLGDLAAIDLGTPNTAFRFTDVVSDGGCDTTGLWVVELTPERPVLRLGAPLDSSNSGEVGADGKERFEIVATVGRLPHGPGLQIRYRGVASGRRPVDETVRYAGHGDIWRAQPAENRRHCFFDMFGDPIADPEATAPA